MRIFVLVLAWLALSAQAAEPVLRPSARLLFKQPEMLKAGQCVRYEEGGAGWIKKKNEKREKKEGPNKPKMEKKKKKKKKKKQKKKTSTKKKKKNQKKKEKK
eukprot:TRINITY_DN4364_c0_g1_i1.p5 TRINITY_DN4364_c0_g1~~TRINITY_DN4364_c0_g1_i1.p5  ORF type:complete len:102 (-),score=33.98 TRINITY_DN4364_c0_g1_i1:77-382(-)